ncbi:MAG: hypothetical protein WCZ18_06700 [Ottowia sp.]|nr:hypothetical protein [Ottowia sp.]
MNARLLILSLSLCAASLCSAAAAGVRAPPQDADDASFAAWITGQREDVAQQRAAAIRAFEAQELVCWRRFAVNDCLRAARSKRRQQLDALRKQDLQLNDLERQRRADKRLRAIGDKEEDR